MDCEVVFFPNKANEQKIIDFINQAKKELKVCVFTFTNQNIALAILNKVVNEKVKVRIITDDMQNAGPYSIANVLQSASEDLIKFRTDLRKDAHMHHKYVVIDDKLIATGSFNWTQAAVMKNNENLLLIRDEKIAKQFSKNFEELWSEFASTEMTLSQLSSQIRNRGDALKIKASKQKVKSNGKDDTAQKKRGKPSAVIKIDSDDDDDEKSAQAPGKVKAIRKQKGGNNGTPASKSKSEAKEDIKKKKYILNLEQISKRNREVSKIQATNTKNEKQKNLITNAISFALGATSAVASYFIANYLPAFLF